MRNLFSTIKLWFTCCFPKLFFFCAGENEWSLHSASVFKEGSSMFSPPCRLIGLSSCWRLFQMCFFTSHWEAILPSSRFIVGRVILFMMFLLLVVFLVLCTLDSGSPSPFLFMVITREHFILALGECLLCFFVWACMVALQTVFFEVRAFL